MHSDVKAEDCHVEVPRPKGAGSTLRKPTFEEMAKAVDMRAKTREARAAIQKAQAVLDSLKEPGIGCDHKLIYDVAGMIYNSRYCYGCGRFMGDV